MSPFNHLPRLAVTAALGVAVVSACGPFFSIEVLRNREQVLLAPPAVSFEAELKALAPPPQDKLPVVESGDSNGDEPNRATVETQELIPRVLTGVSAMWLQTSGDAAYALGQELPPPSNSTRPARSAFFTASGKRLECTFKRFSPCRSRNGRDANCGLISC